MKIFNKILTSLISVFLICFISIVALVFLTVFMPENVKEAFEILKTIFNIN
jgi:hypothetical protein